MVGQARFTYTDEDMIAMQRAWWAWLTDWRHLLVAYAGLVVLSGLIAAGIDAAHGTPITRADVLFVMFGPVAEIAGVLVALFIATRTHGQQVLHGNQAFVWSGDELGGQHEWAWDDKGLRTRHARGHADLAWTSVGAWLDAPKVLLLFPSEGRAFALPERVLAAGWSDAPKVFIIAFGGYALTLPKRALAAGDAERLIDVLRSSGVRERRRFGLIAAKGSDAPYQRMAGCSINGCG